MLDCGVALPSVTVAYRTYGALNAKRSNAVLVCHALTGDQYVAEPHPGTGKPGWWNQVVGPGRTVDTKRFFVICANVLGGCMGSTGPRSPRDDGPDAPPWGTDFPPVTIRDMVRAQRLLIDHMGITRLFAAIGGSMGGMQVLEWAATFPDMVFAAVPVATASFHSAQNIAFHEVGRQAIFADPNWDGGEYWRHDRIPARGLAVARMAAHITYLSEQALTRKFGRRLQAPASGGTTLFGDMFEVESYLRHQGSTFVDRFDANSYLTITRAMDYFDLAADHDGDLAAAFRGIATRFCIASFDSDWLFPTARSRAIARALNRAGVNVSFVEIGSDKGHDAFLLDEPDFHRALSGFLSGCSEHAGLGPHLPASGRLDTPAAERLNATSPERPNAPKMRFDLRLMSEMIDPGSRVLDIGSGDGTLIEYLFRTRGCDARGIEIDMAEVTRAVAHGLPVMHGDADSDLAHYPDALFDYVVLSRTLQAVERPQEVLRQMLRIGTRALVSFPNFGHWQVRWQLVRSGRMPMTATWDRPWYETPNIHPCTIRDFFALCAQEGYVVERWLAVDDEGRQAPWRRFPGLANLFGEQALFMLRRA